MIRNFAKIFGLKIGLFCFGLVLNLTTLEAQELNRWEYSTPCMGTNFRIVLYSVNKENADQTAKDAFARIEQINQIMSDYLPESEVSFISQRAGSGAWIKVSPELYKVLKKSKKWSRKSKGKFDITIGPLSKIWRRAFRQQQFPDTAQINRAKELVNYRWLKIHPFSKKVKLKRKGMQLDLGGIAKGYALDEAMKVLKQEKISSALIDGGGDILVSGAPPDSQAWKITIPRSDSIIYLSNQAIATSGDTFRFLEWKGHRYSHIIDPDSGYGIQNPVQVSVIVESGLTADVLASILSIVDQANTKKWKRKYKIMYN